LEAIAASWFAVRVAISWLVCSFTSSVWRRSDCCCRVASRFLVSISTLVSCSMSLTDLRRASVSRVSASRPSASKALVGSKNSFLVWLSEVSDTLSSSRPFWAMSSATTWRTCCTNSARRALRSYIVIFTATAPQRVDELGLDLRLQRMRVEGEHAERLRRLRHRLGVGLDSHVELHPHVDPQPILGDQRLAARLVDLEPQRLHVDDDDLVDARAPRRRRR
jgi:hypothetical protein